MILPGNSAVKGNEKWGATDKDIGEGGSRKL